MPNIGGRQALGHDSGPDHGDEEQAGAERLGDDARQSLTAPVLLVQASAGQHASSVPHAIAGASASTV